MKKIIVALMTTVLAINAQVTLPHYDGLDYPAGQALQTQTGWTPINTGDDLTITAGSLSFASLPTSTGNKVAFVGKGIDACKFIPSTTSGSIYFSFLMNITAIASDAAGGYFTGVMSTLTDAATQYGSSVWIKKDATDPTKYNIGLNPRTTATNNVWTANAYIVNEPHLMVLKYQVVEGITNDVVSLWIDPQTGLSTEPAALLSATNSLADLQEVARIFIRQDADIKTSATEMDELRIGTTWADVTPSSGSSIDNNNTALSDVVISAYPNPFNPTTSISFTLPQALNGSLTVYNQAGQKVTELFNGQMNQGLNSFQFNAADLNSGVYFCKLVSGTNSFTHKMVLTK